MQFKIRGKIEIYSGGTYPKILIVHPKNKWRMDLIARVIELGYNSKHGEIQCNYTIADNEISDIELKEVVINKLCGGISADYSSYETGYSSWTQWTEYDTEFRIGGHDLFKELKSCVGKYLLLEINYKPLPHAY